MKNVLVIIFFTAVVALGVVVILDKLQESSSTPATGAPPGGGGGGAKTGGTGTGGGGTGGGAVPSPTGGAAKPGGGGAGRIDTSLRGTSGSERVSCGAISTEFKVTASEATVRWTAHARDSHPGSTKPYSGAALPGVTVEPSAGSLEPGASVVIRIRGSFGGRSGQRFWVVVEPNGSVQGMKAVDFSCR